MKVGIEFFAKPDRTEFYECEKAYLRRSAEVLEIVQKDRTICFPYCNIKLYVPERTEEMQGMRDNEQGVVEL
jgi:hypothetical protein